MTVGLDDTIKTASRHQSYNVKADNITIPGEGSKRNTFTTWLPEIASHEGKEHAIVYEQKLKCLAVLSESTVDELQRLHSCHFGIDEERVLKSWPFYAHIILWIGKAADWRFRIAQQ